LTPLPALAGIIAQAMAAEVQARIESRVSAVSAVIHGLDLVQTGGKAQLSAVGSVAMPWLFGVDGLPLTSHKPLEDRLEALPIQCCCFSALLS
jgi:hypothetical protein